MRRNRRTFHRRLRPHGLRILHWMFCKPNRFSYVCAAHYRLSSMNHKNSCGRHSHKWTRRSQSRFSSDDAAYRNIYSTHRWRSCDFHNRSWNIRRYGRMPFGYVDWKKNYSTSRSSCCGWRIRNPNRRSSGNRLRAGAARLNTAPSLYKNSCGRLRRWSRACSDRNRSYTPGNRCVCRLHHFRNPVPTNGFRNPGKSKNHTSRNHDLYTHKCRDFLCNDIYSTRSTRHGRARCASTGNVGALQRILLAAWAGADNAGGRTVENSAGAFLMPDLQVAAPSAF